MNFDAVLNLDICAFFEYIKTIRYGYQDRNGQLHFIDAPDFLVREYVFSAPEEVVSNNCGWCWDVANLIRAYCKRNGFLSKTYFLEYDSPSFHQTHTQVVIRCNDFWFIAPDNSSPDQFGELGFSSLQECIRYFEKQFVAYLQYELKDSFNPEQLLVKEFDCEIPSGISDDAYTNLVRQ